MKVFATALLLALTACGGTSVIDAAEEEQHARAQLEWEALGGVSQALTCELYSELGYDGMIEFTLDNDSRFSRSEVTARVDVIQENC